MLARIAHELFWLGRNLVRAEHTARMLDGVFQADVQGRPDDPAGVTLSWGSILAIMGANPEGAPARRDDVLERLTLDAEDPFSVVSCVRRGREGARTVRDVISAEMWEAVNTTNLTLLEGDLSARLRTGPYSFYQYVKERSALFWGLTGRTMLRDDASAFLMAGGRIEAADMVLRMLRVALPVGDPDTAARDGQALALLQAVGGFQAFRRAVPGPPNAQPVARFLLFERAYPDSVAASVDALLRAIDRADMNPRNSEPVLRLTRLGADLEFRRRAADDGTEDGDLQSAFERIQSELALVDIDIAERYFAGASALGVVTT
ncbi:alpha-E domain-containing protein [Paraconexibacter sp.]|uniref:alpha-E domain-containing protein n=1 Tax=Paraconexibacter sp. TaxID=2949640 RepID=UPI00356755F9